MKKDKEWLKGEINSELMVYSGNPNMGSYDYGRVSGLNYALKLINQLEEPSVRNETVNDILDSNRKLSKRIKELENKLEEPKQEKPVIPQFVADWIEDKKDWTAFEVFYDIDEQNIESDKVSEWLYDNDDEENAKREIMLLQSLRSGYTVKKEKLYIVKFAPSIFGTSTYGSIGTQNGKKIMQSVYGSQEGVIIPNQYTRREIEEVGSKYMAFAEEVTE